VIGGFVGADCSAVIAAEEPYNSGRPVMLIDLGTNGEIVMGGSDRLLAASCATGPAFEGAQIKNGMRAAPGAIEKIMIDPCSLEASYKVIGREGWSAPLSPMDARGICGSGIIDAVGRMFAAGIIDAQGAFVKGLESPRLIASEGGPEYIIAWGEETASGKPLGITQSDIRAVQLAKAAVRTGAEILILEYGRPPEIIKIAGAFGNFIDRESAELIGMLPKSTRNMVCSVGNAAGDGAVIALLSQKRRARAEAAAAKTERVELSTHPAFNKLFIDALSFSY
jgi:uncharacterized 2Fe-2S/4Fe-4S cluster protein (DUF4445 family)